METLASYPKNFSQSVAPNLLACIECSEFLCIVNDSSFLQTISISRRLQSPKARLFTETLNKISKPYIVNDNEHRRNRQYIGSAHAEKACDLIVAKRQKNRGMHWSEEIANALAAMKTVMLNQAWELYWVNGQVLPLAINP